MAPEAMREDAYAWMLNPVNPLPKPVDERYSPHPKK